jgi:hypothetical protein
MIALSLPCDGMDSSRRWFESYQSFCLFVYIVKLSYLEIAPLSIETYLSY